LESVGNQKERKTEANLEKCRFGGRRELWQNRREVKRLVDNRMRRRYVIWGFCSG
jgi:hypothetical protein